MIFQPLLQLFFYWIYYFIFIYLFNGLVDYPGLQLHVPCTVSCCVMKLKMMLNLENSARKMFFFFILASLTLHSDTSTPHPQSDSVKKTSGGVSWRWHGESSRKEKILASFALSHRFKRISMY